MAGAFLIALSSRLKSAMGRTADAAMVSEENGAFPPLCFGSLPVSLAALPAKRMKVKPRILQFRMIKPKTMKPRTRQLRSEACQKGMDSLKTIVVVYFFI